MELMCFRNCWLCSAIWMTKVLFTNLSHNFGGWVAVFIALISNSPMSRLATIGLMGNLIAASCACSKNLPWKRKWVFCGRTQTVWYCNIWR